MPGDGRASLKSLSEKDDLRGPRAKPGDDDRVGGTDEN